MSGDKEDKPRRLIIGVTGATGSIFAVRMLEALRKTDVESHLVLSRWGARTLLHETDYTLDQVRSLATHWYKDNDQGARISSGSFVTLGMVIVPCSVKTLADIAHGHSNELVHRAADVVLKERRRLVLAVREAPFTDIHLENMLKLSRMGVVISPPMPAFYNRPRVINDIVDHTVARLLDLFSIDLKGAQRWTGEMGVGAADPAPLIDGTTPSRRPSEVPTKRFGLTSPRRKPGPSAKTPSTVRETGETRETTTRAPRRKRK